jgi:class 3 adenylate cyclase
LPRLQSTDIPGLVQVSEATYKLIADGSYQIDPKGEIELKGKGKQMTYLVHPRERP